MSSKPNNNNNKPKGKQQNNNNAAAPPPPPPPPPPPAPISQWSKGPPQAKAPPPFAAATTSTTNTKPVVVTSIIASNDNKNNNKNAAAANSAAPTAIPALRRHNIAIWVGRPGVEASKLKNDGIDLRFFESIDVAEQFLRAHLNDCSFPDKPNQVYAFVVETKAGIEFILKEKKTLCTPNKIQVFCLVTPWSASEISNELYSHVRSDFDSELDCRSFGAGSYYHQMLGILYRTFLNNQSSKQQLSAAVPVGLPRSAKFLGSSPLGEVWSFFDPKTKATMVARHVCAEKRTDTDIEQYRRRSLLSPEFVIPALPIVTKPKFNNLVISEKYEKHLEMIFKSEPLPLYLCYKIIRVCLKAMEELHKHKCFFRCLSPLIICYDQVGKVRVETSFMVLGEHPTMWENSLLPRFCAPELLSRENLTPNNNSNNNNNSATPPASAATATKKFPIIPEACDVWCLGFCCVRLLTGNQPFTDANCREGQRDLEQLITLFTELNNKGEEYTPELPSYTPPKFRSLIHRMLRMNPKDRITVPELLADELFQEENLPNKPVDEQDERLDLATHFKQALKNDSEKFRELEDLLVRSQRKSRIKANGFTLVEAWAITNKHLNSRMTRAGVANARRKRDAAGGDADRAGSPKSNNGKDTSPTLSSSPSMSMNKSLHHDPNLSGGGTSSSSKPNNNNNTDTNNANDDENDDNTNNTGPIKSTSKCPKRIMREEQLELDDALVAFAGVHDSQVEQCLRHGILPAGHRLNIHETPNIGSGAIGSLKRGVYLYRFPVSAAKAKKADELKEGDLVDIIMFDIAGGYRTAEFDGTHQFRADQYELADIFVSRDELYCVWPNVVMQPKYVLRLKVQRSVMTSLIGPRRFIVLPKVLGAGGFGKVYSALQLPEHKPVACKTYHISQDSVEACMTEFNAMSSVREYEHVAKVISVEMHEGMAFLFMELLSCSLLDIVEAAGSLPEEQVTKYFYEAACGLESLALEGKVHQDIKPANLMVSSEGLVKLVDFGLMGAVGDTDLKGFTMNFVAPELLMARKRGEKIPFTHASDVYSLGVSMFMLLKGWTKFRFDSVVTNNNNNNVNSPEKQQQQQQNEDDMERSRKVLDFVDVRQDILMKEMSTLNWISPQLKRTLYRCLDLDPNRRPKLSELTQLEAYYLSSSSPTKSSQLQDGGSGGGRKRSGSKIEGAVPGSSTSNKKDAGKNDGNDDEIDDDNNNNTLNSENSLASSNSLCLMTRTVTFASFLGGGGSSSSGGTSRNNNLNNISSGAVSSANGNNNNVGSAVVMGGSNSGSNSGAGNNNNSNSSHQNNFEGCEVTETINFGNVSMMNSTFNNLMPKY